MQFQLQKFEKYVKFKNHLKRPRGAFNHQLWELEFFKILNFKTDYP